ncbi:phosphatidylinositol-specific phospholipase C1-like protein [Aquihabitans daechungensis]|uniref:phosphatidylinositol-specific phospholipase C1-like protein n=1 Tax=Aquihabitans daechungensis TaxID=1052257 RepID=UPI003B9F289E
MRHRRFIALGSVAAALAAVALVTGAPVSSRPAAPAGPAAVAGVDDDVHLNEIQVVGSHNSYKKMVSPEEEELRRSVIGSGADLMQYEHPPLPIQFQSQKVRQIELDVFLDESGGRYANPLLRTAAGKGPYDPKMQEPGIKALHIQDVDYATTCLTFIDCLQQIKGWSDANPSHVPIAVLVELKDDPLDFPGFTFTIPEKWTAANIGSVDDEIRSVMDDSDLLTPDDVRGSHPTLEDAVTTDGWPTLGESRGKVMFMMDNGGGYRTDYLSGHPTLEDRVLFTNAEPGNPDAAFVKRNDPFAPDIPDLVTDGYVVRTRSDADTREARDNDTGPRDAALASGAQWVSTDYQAPGMAVGFTTPYVVEIPGGTVARCNPVNGPPTCESALLDTIYTPIAPPTTTTSSPTTSTTVVSTDPNDATGAVPVPALGQLHRLTSAARA